VLAAESIDSGRARGALEKLARMTSAAPRPDARKG
jgi:hypothetical protein